MTSYDYIVVGAGSAGCVMAARLSEDETASVLLLEAGGRDNSLLVHMPGGIADLLKKPNPYNWYFETEGQPHLNARKLYWPRGRGFGGSSSINGMVYIRGHARDYDLWRQQGLEGWGFADVLPYFRRSETNEGGADAFRGADGPLHVSDFASFSPLPRTFVEAGKEAGYPYTEDFNGAQQEGFGLYQSTTHKRKRWSAAAAYLTPALDRKNLTVISHALGHRVLFEKGRAVGVEYGRKGKREIAYAKGEVILCGGAVNSPHLLLLSGIGPADYLKRFDIPVIADLPGVGQNLQDHLDITVLYECTRPEVTYFPTQRNPLRKVKSGIEYLLFAKGMAGEIPTPSGGFIKTSPDLDLPDVQFHFLSTIAYNHGREPTDRAGFMAHACQLRPESRGFIALKSGDPSMHPLIQPNYLEAEKDRVVMRESVKILREIFAQSAFDAYRGPEVAPGAAVQTDDQIDAFIRARAETIYHPVGTCKMGRDDQAVVDETLKVRGIEALRVVDASVMPTLIGGNTNAPTIMIAEKASDMIRGLKPPAPLEVTIAEDERPVAAA